MLLHDGQGCLVEERDIGRDPAFCALGYGSGIPPDQDSAGPLKAKDQLLKVLRVLIDGDLLMALANRDKDTFIVAVFEVMQAPVEMDDIPVACSKPCVELFQAACGGSAIGRRPVHIGLALE